MSFLPNQHQALSRLLNDELELAQRMFEIMESEHATLSGDTPSAISASSKEKLTHMQLMEQQIGRRDQFLKELAAGNNQVIE